MLYKNGKFLHKIEQKPVLYEEGGQGVPTPLGILRLTTLSLRYNEGKYLKNVGIYL